MKKLLLTEISVAILTVFAYFVSMQKFGIKIEELESIFFNISLVSFIVLVILVCTGTKSIPGPYIFSDTEIDAGPGITFFTFIVGSIVVSASTVLFFLSFILYFFSFFPSLNFAKIFCPDFLFSGLFCIIVALFIFVVVSAIFWSFRPGLSFKKIFAKQIVISFLILLLLTYCSF